LQLNSGTLLRLLEAYGGPQALSQDPAGKDQLARWGRALLKPQKLAAVLASAQATVGVRMQPADVAFVRRCAAAALAARQEIRKARKSLTERAAKNADLQRVGQGIGVVTACVLWAVLGNPRITPAERPTAKRWG